MPACDLLGAGRQRSHGAGPCGAAHRDAVAGIRCAIAGAARRTADLQACARSEAGGPAPPESRAAPRADQASPASMSRRSWNGARSGDYTEAEDSLALLAVRAAILVLLRNVFALGGAEQL